jgi:predicted ArsR family transcriptional regulator
MSNTDSPNVPRTPDGPTKQDILAEMRPCESYKAADINEQFSDVSRWTIQRRLDSLHAAGDVEKKKHADDSVSWFIRADVE